MPSKDSETILSGKAFGLSFVHSIASIHNRNASRITWHEHSVAECLFVIEGSTEYEFIDHKTVDLPGGHFLIIPAFVRHRGVQDVRRPGRLCSIQVNLDAKRTTSIAPFSAMEFRWLGVAVPQCVVDVLFNEWRVAKVDQRLFRPDRGF